MQKHGKSRVTWPDNHPHHKSLSQHEHSQEHRRQEKDSMHPISTVEGSLTKQTLLQLTQRHCGQQHRHTVHSAMNTGHYALPAFTMASTSRIVMSPLCRDTFSLKKVDCPLCSSSSPFPKKKMKSVFFSLSVLVVSTVASIISHTAV